MPQLPQFRLSFCGFSQNPLHEISPLGHEQADEKHELPLMHTVPHAPQSSGSVVVSTQVIEHTISLLPQPHAPLLHERPGSHAMSH